MTDAEFNEIAIRIYNAKTRPTIDKVLVVGWRSGFPITHLLEYRKKRDAFYNFETQTEIDFYVYLADLAGVDGALAIRERWNERDRKN